jgi:hypothetical protein
MAALPNVNVTTKKSDVGTVTDIRGSFTLETSKGDSIIFSRVGYFTKILPVEAVRDVVIIFLKEESRMLRPVEIQDRVNIPWLPVLPPFNPWKNPTFDPRSTPTPGFQGVQTFGPGYVFRGALSRFTKEEKEKRKLAKVLDENYRSRNYVGLVNDPEVKGKIIEDYNLTEDDYYRFLAKFNEINKDVIYRLESHEVVALLVLFFSENAPKKE